jgi:predicted alpha-1,2-mannosidase
MDQSLLKKTFVASLVIGALISLSARAEEPVEYVRPMIGTDGGSGHTFPGASVPFGMVQLSPDTTISGWASCAGYDYNNNTILGFSHIHLSGVGIPDMGFFLLMPTVGDLKLPADKPSAGYCATFSHDQEEARAGYYRVNLTDRNVMVELTATTRAGMHRYTFPKTDKAHVVLDLLHGIDFKHHGPLEMGLQIENDHTISGFRKEEKGWGGEITYYFVAEFSRPWMSAGIQSDGQRTEARHAESKNIQAWFDFKTHDHEQILVRVAISSVDVEGARKNLRAEMPGWDFNAVAKAARVQWEDVVSRVAVESSDKLFLENFYTAVYHANLAPTTHSDVDGRYRGPDGQVHVAHDFTYYTTYSLWDAMRATFPLFTILQPERVNGFIKTMIQHYKISPEKALPHFLNAGLECWTMGGNHGIPVIVDAYLKGFRDFNATLALEAMDATMMSSRRAQDQYNKLGYISADRNDKGTPKIWYNATKTLELAYDDACVARMAEVLGNKEIAAKYQARANNWKNLWDDQIGFVRPKYSDGRWMEPFDPNEVNQDIEEGNSRQYSFMVQHDAPALVAKLGGPEKFVERLDTLFDTREPVKFKQSKPDVQGLIGQYCHGNEPCHHDAYLYDYAGRPDKTQQRIRQIVSTMYKPTFDGLCGNDDCGQMSAWYVFSALGFYPVDPASGIYMIGSPTADKATITVDSKSGLTFTIVARNNSPTNIYIQSAMLNGKPLDRSWLRHSEITAGGELVLKMGPTANRKWGQAPLAF